MDNLLRSKRDEPTLGIILCKSKERTLVEYALQGIQTPISVSSYQLATELPEPLKRSLPTVDHLEMELNTAIIKVQLEVDE